MIPCPDGGHILKYYIITGRITETHYTKLDST